MSSSHCKLYPDAPNGKTSKLFKDILDHTNSREMARMAWGFSQTDLFKSQFSDLKKDENGEVTYEELSKVLGIDSIISRTQKDVNRAVDMGLESKDGTPSTFKDAEAALAKASDYNSTSDTKIAVVERDDDGNYKTVVKDTDALSIADADKNESRRQLNRALIAILHKAGFDVEFTKDTSYYGVFDPLLAENNVNTLRTVIRIANNELGLDALPEEAAHLILAGLKGHALKQRLDAVCTNSVVKQILGSEYELYRNEYSDGKMLVEDRLREEAEGKLLARVLRNDASINPQENKVKEQTKPLLSRIWSYAKSLFSKNISEKDIDNAIVNAENAIRPIADLIKTGEISTILDKEQIMAHEKLYALANKTEKLAMIAQDGETMLSKKLYILQNTQTEQDTKALRNSIKAVRRAISNEHYASACYSTLSAIGKDIKELAKEADQLGSVYANTTDLNLISSEAGLVNRMSSAVQAYTKYLTTLSGINTLIKRGQIDMDPEWALPISNLAKEYLETLNILKEDIGSMRFAVLKQLVSLYYGNMGEMPEGFTETDKYKWQSVDMILSKATSDISWWDSNLFSAGDSRNPLLNVIHHIVVSQQAKRNNKINRLCMEMQEADAKLKAAGYDNRFIYGTDEKGVPTGFYVAPVDFVRFEKERDEYKATLDPEVLDAYEIQRRMEEWDAAHLEEKKVGKPNEKGEYRTEMMPKESIYKVEGFQQGWSQEQKDYYKAVLDMKAEMDSYLPVSMQQLYIAPQVRKSVTQMFDKGGRGAAGTIWQRWKQDFSVIEDNEEYSNDAVAKKTKKLMLGFDDKPIKRVPVYFVKPLEDMRDLSTDGTHAIFSYISMAVNYSEMGQLANAMRLMQDHVSSDEFEVVQTSGGRTIKDMFKSAHRTYTREYTKSGEGTRLVKAINEYIDRQFFNDTKEVIGDIQLTENHALNADALFNIFMKITSVGRMGFNVLSGITNATQGETQMICEAMAKRYFDTKDLAWTKKEYNKLLFPYMGSFNSANRHDKMYLLINQFNSSEDFFKDMKDKDFNKSAYKRVMGRGNVYFLNSMGEHYLHTSGMLAVLHHEKVKRLSDPNKVVSLYDVIKEVHDEKGWHLELDSDIEFVDGKRSFLQSLNLGEKPIVRKERRDELFNNLAIYINNINAGMHGGYSEAEKGNANRQALWRAVLQFRQWMFGMYNKLYSRPYYDATTMTMKEGGYYSMYKFLVGCLHDLKTMSIKKAIENNHLTNEQKKNVAVAMTQSAIFVLLMGMCALTSGWKDRDERSIRLLAYQMKRLRTETGALSIFPFPWRFIDNVFTLIQSPAAGVKTLENLSQLFDFTNIAFWSESGYIKSGRFRGWYKPLKAAWTLTPIYNIQRLVDMDDYNYMFNIFND